MNEFKVPAYNRLKRESGKCPVNVSFVGFCLASGQLVIGETQIRQPWPLWASSI